jgi:hypothetical protein
MVTGHAGTGMVWGFCTHGHTATLTRGVAVFNGYFSCHQGILFLTIYSTYFDFSPLLLSVTQVTNFATPQNLLVYWTAIADTFVGTSTYMSVRP